MANANSAGGQDDVTREIVPSDLLPVHEGLEEDGESWRAHLPRPENLLRRVRVPAPHDGSAERPQCAPMSISVSPSDALHSATGHTRAWLLRIRDKRKDFPR